MQATCSKCGKEFITSNSGKICYDCTLESLVQGQSPEEGDFNTARIVSGEMSEDERRLLQEDLRSVDWAACQPDPEDDFEGRDEDY